jgi:uncharacterized protein (DUF58 family)
LISDFFSLPGWEKPLALLNRRHDLVAIRLWDQREVELPASGMMYVQDSESGEQLYLDSGDPTFRRRLRQAVLHREERLSASLKRAGVELFAMSTEDDLVRSLVRMVAIRKRRRR